MPPSEWTFQIPAPCKWLSANDRRHRYATAALVKQWRQATVQCAMAARLPKELDRISIDAQLSFPTVRNRDEANYHDTLKPIVDGLCRDRSYLTSAGRSVFAPGYGLIYDDTPQHLVAAPRITIAAVVVPAPGYVLLTITDESPAVALGGLLA